MKDFFLYLKFLIDESGDFGNVYLWNDQPEKIRERKHRPHKNRSVYIEFVLDEPITRQLGINDYDLIVRTKLAIDNKKFSKIEDLEYLDKLNGVLQNKSHSEDGVFSFSSMQRTYLELDVDHDQVSEPFNEYSTKLRDFSGYQRKSYTEGTFSSTNITVSIE